MSGRSVLAPAAAVPAAVAMRCGSSGGGPKPIPDGGISITVCDPAAGPFSTTIDNPYLPMPAGMLHVLTGMDGGLAVRLELRVLDQAEVVAGVTTLVLEERELHDGALAEVSRNFFAQAADGSVCYFGEDVNLYSGGGQPVAVPAGTYTDTIRTREWTPLEPDDEEFKAYARGVGLIVDAEVSLQP